MSSTQIKLFVTPIVRGTRWQMISEAVKNSGISREVGYVSLRPGTKNDFAVVTVDSPKNGHFNSHHLNTLERGGFLKIYNQDGSRYWKAYLYKPLAQKVTHSAMDSATELLASLSIGDVVEKQSRQPSPECDIETVSSFSGSEDSYYVDDVDDPDSDGAGLFIDYAKLEHLLCLSRLPAKRMRIKPNQNK